MSRIFRRFNSDRRITAWHISIYMGLFYLWSLDGMKNPIQVTRRKLMELSHIQSFMTYHKCMKQLQEFGYIEYVPSYHPLLGSRVSLLLGE